ncbi:MAG: V0D/AC39 family V-type ATPase subunit [Lachnospiraceae bacterium]
MSLLSYSGITTKVKAMHGRLISEDQFREMAALDTVQSALDYLKHQPAYAGIFAHIDDTMLHRGNIEKLLILSKFQDFTKLYKFSDLKQRKFLDLYFMHYEITIIKRCLRNIMSHQKTELDLSLYREFFDRHSHINLVKLAEAENLDEFIADLSGSIYYDLIKDLQERAATSVFDYEMRLDLLYFKTMWKTASKSLSKNDRRFVSSIFGNRLDLLNIQWIYRSIKYYALTPEQIKILLIPFHFKLKQDQIDAMTKCHTIDQFFSILKDTYYHRISTGLLTDQPDVEFLYTQILDRIYKNNSRKHPYSIAIVEAYLYFKEAEQRKLITVIEGIRYGLNTNDIISLAAKS